MSDFLFVGVFPGGVVRTGTTSNVRQFLKNWKRRYGVFLPVVCHRVDLDLVFSALTKYGHPISKLPTHLTIAEAAKFFGWAPVDPAAVKAVLSHIRQLGPTSGRLLSEWGRAVIASQN